MNDYRPSPALDLPEYIRQAEPYWHAAGYKPLPFGSVALVLAVPQSWTWPEVSREEALAGLYDVRDMLMQTLALVDERICPLEAQVAAQFNPIC